MTVDWVLDLFNLLNDRRPVIEWTSRYDFITAAQFTITCVCRQRVPRLRVTTDISLHRRGKHNLWYRQKYHNLLSMKSSAPKKGAFLNWAFLRSWTGYDVKWKNGFTNVKSTVWIARMTCIWYWVAHIGEPLWTGNNQRVDRIKFPIVQGWKLSEDHTTFHATYSPRDYHGSFFLFSLLISSARPTSSCSFLNDPSLWSLIFVISRAQFQYSLVTGLVSESIDSSFYLSSCCSCCFENQPQFPVRYQSKTDYSFDFIRLGLFLACCLLSWWLCLQFLCRCCDFRLW